MFSTEASPAELAAIEASLVGDSDDDDPSLDALAEDAALHVLDDLVGAVDLARAALRGEPDGRLDEVQERVGEQRQRERQGGDDQQPCPSKVW